MINTCGGGFASNFSVKLNAIGISYLLSGAFIDLLAVNKKAAI
jgi:hypothetical protein